MDDRNEGNKTYDKMSLKLGLFEIRITNLLNLVSETRNNDMARGEGAHKS